jgi:hypothetical protein
MGYLQLYPPNSTYLFLLMLAIIGISSWLSRRISKRIRQQVEFETVVDVLERTMAKGQYTKIERKAVWREVVNRLVEDAKLGAQPPTASELLAAAAREVPGLGDRPAKS